MAKRMFRWWSYVRAMVRDYPRLCAESPRTPDDIRERKAVEMAIELTRKRRGGLEHIALIESVYWGRKQRRVKEAAVLMFVSVPTAKRWHGEFIKLVGKCWGFEV